MSRASGAGVATANRSTVVFTEFEIGSHRSEAGSYQVELRFTYPASEAENARGTASFDLAQLLVPSARAGGLRAGAHSPAATGRRGEVLVDPMRERARREDAIP